MVSLAGHNFPSNKPTRRPGFRIIADIDPEVQSLWDQLRAATGDESKRLMEAIVAAGKRQRGEE